MTRPRTTASVAALLALVPALAQPAAAAQDRVPSAAARRDSQRRQTFEEAVAGTLGGLVEDLEALAEWCQENKLFLERDRVYEAILVHEPDHAAARKTLKYRRDRSGAWVRSSSYRPPKNRGDDEAMAALAERRAAATNGYVQRVMAVIADFVDQIGTERAEREWRELLVLEPDNEELHALLGEARLGDRWVLRETARSPESRARLGALVARCLEQAPRGYADVPNAFEERLGLRWSEVLQSGDTRVLGTGRPEEVRNVLQVGGAAIALFQELFGSDARPYAGHTVCLLARPGEKDVFLDRHPNVGPENRDFLSSLKSAGIPRTAHTAEWAETEVERLDRSTRQTLGLLLNEGFGISTRHGWAWEGIGLYLTYQLTGTRMTYFVRPGKYAEGDPTSSAQEKLMGRLTSPGADWLHEAREFFGDRPPPRLALLMGRDVNDMSATDLLHAYVFASFLIEGWPDELPRLLEAIGDGASGAEAVGRTFGFELPRLQERVWSWLEESGPR